MGQLNVGEVTATNTVSCATLDASSGVQLPLFTTANLPANAQGKMVYDTDVGAIKVNDGSAWAAVAGSGGGGGVIRQFKYKISTVTNTHNSTSMIEVDSDYRLYITPTSNDSIIAVDYTLPLNEQCANNTIFILAATRNGSRTDITSAGGSSGSRWAVAGGGHRPGNGYDTNDMSVRQWRIIDVPNTTSEIYYGFHCKQETSGVNNIRFGFSDSDNNNWGWRSNIVITATEYAPPS